MNARFEDCMQNTMVDAMKKIGHSHKMIGKCPKNLNTKKKKVSYKMTYANSADPDQTAPQGAV